MYVCALQGSQKRILYPLGVELLMVFSLEIWILCLQILCDQLIQAPAPKTFMLSGTVPWNCRTESPFSFLNHLSQGVCLRSEMGN